MHLIGHAPQQSCLQAFVCTRIHTYKNTWSNPITHSTVHRQNIIEQNNFVGVLCGCVYVCVCVSVQSDMSKLGSQLNIQNCPADLISYVFDGLGSKEDALTFNFEGLIHQLSLAVYALYFLGENVEKTTTFQPTMPMHLATTHLSKSQDLCQPRLFE